MPYFYMTCDKSIVFAVRYSESLVALVTEEPIPTGMNTIVLNGEQQQALFVMIDVGMLFKAWAMKNSQPSQWRIAIS